METLPKLERIRHLTLTPGMKLVCMSDMRQGDGSGLGGRSIRIHDTLARDPVFKIGAINPRQRPIGACGRSYRVW